MGGKLTSISSRSISPTGELEKTQKLVSLLRAQCAKVGYPITEEYAEKKLAINKNKILPAIEEVRKDIDTSTFPLYYVRVIIGRSGGGEADV